MIKEMASKKLQLLWQWIRSCYKYILIVVGSTIMLMIIIGLLTTANPSSRLSSNALTKWTSNVDGTFFSSLFGMESKPFRLVTKMDEQKSIFKHILSSLTHMNVSDMKSYLRSEIPGFFTYEHHIIIAGEGMNEDTVFSDESGPPLDDILQERLAISDEEDGMEEDNESSESHSEHSIDENVVFLYSSHNRESFLPHLPEETDANLAYHEEMNITKVSNRIAEQLKAHAIGATVDDTDFTNILNDKGWSYGKSYAASRPVVEEALATDKDLQYVFDIHRDSLPRDLTTKEIHGVSYSKLLFVIGAAYKTYEKNLKLATDLHYLIEEQYPGLSRGVITKSGPNANGVYNQDLSENAILIEVGGHENTLEEMYQTADVLAEIFANYYNESVKVSKE